MNIVREHQIGTLSYMAPEAVKPATQMQSNGVPVKLGRASDVWALGIILYQITRYK